MGCTFIEFLDVGLAFFEGVVKFGGSVSMENFLTRSRTDGYTVISIEQMM